MIITDTIEAGHQVMVWIAKWRKRPYSQEEEQRHAREKDLGSYKLKQNKNATVSTVKLADPRS